MMKVQFLLYNNLHARQVHKQLQNKAEYTDTQKMEIFKKTLFFKRLIKAQESTSLQSKEENKVKLIQKNGLQGSVFQSHQSQSSLTLKPLLKAELGTSKIVQEQGLKQKFKTENYIQYLQVPSMYVIIPEVTVQMLYGQIQNISKHLKL